MKPLFIQSPPPEKTNISTLASFCSSLVNTSEQRFCLNSCFCLLRNYLKLRERGDDVSPAGRVVHLVISPLTFVFPLLILDEFLHLIMLTQTHLFGCEPPFGAARFQQRLIKACIIDGGQWLSCEEWWGCSQRAEPYIYLWFYQLVSAMTSPAPTRMRGAPHLVHPAAGCIQAQG